MREALSDIWREDKRKLAIVIAAVLTSVAGHNNLPFFNKPSKGAEATAKIDPRTPLLGMHAIYKSGVYTSYNEILIGYKGERDIEVTSTFCDKTQFVSVNPPNSIFKPGRQDMLTNPGACDDDHLSRQETDGVESPGEIAQESMAELADLYYLLPF